MKSLFLDSNILIAATTRPERLPPAVREILADSRNELLASVASLWEVAIKRRKFGDRFIASAAGLRWASREMRVTLLPVDEDAAVSVESVEPGHGDPFDLVILQQAEQAGATLLTSDAALAKLSKDSEHVKLRP